MSPAVFEVFIMLSRHFAGAALVAKPTDDATGAVVKGCAIGSLLGQAPFDVTADHLGQGHAALASLGAQPPRLLRGIYLPLLGYGSLTFYVRSSLPSAAILSSIRRTVSRVDQGLPVEALQTVDSTVRTNVFLDRTIAILSTAFAGLATLLAAVGLYDVLAYTMNRQLRSIAQYDD